MKERLDKPENPDIEFTANVKARELRFKDVPDAEVHPPAQTERRNLPEKVRPVHAGITFRDVSVQVRIANELTVTGPGQGEESKGEQTESSTRDPDPGKPGHAAEQKNGETGKER